MYKISLILLEHTVFSQDLRSLSNELKKSTITEISSHLHKVGGRPYFLLPLFETQFEKQPKLQNVSFIGSY